MQVVRILKRNTSKPSGRRWGVLGALLLAAAAGVGYVVSRVTRKDDNLETEATEVPERTSKTTD